MRFKAFLPVLVCMSLFSCDRPGPKPVQAGFMRILQDTTNNRRAKWELDRLEHYNSICEAIGTNKLCDGVDSFEVRLWRQFSIYGIAADEEIYSLKVSATTVSLTFYRVYCTRESDANSNYGRQNPYTKPLIDSFFAISKSFPIKTINSIDLQNLWDLKTQSALGFPDSIRFLDGTATSIELASRAKYKLISHHVAQAYYNATGNANTKKYIDEYDKLITLFQSKKVYE